MTSLRQHLVVARFCLPSRGMTLLVKETASLQEVCDLSWLYSEAAEANDGNDGEVVALGLVLLYSSWNVLPIKHAESLRKWTNSVMQQQGWLIESELGMAGEHRHIKHSNSALIPFGASVCVDEDDDALSMYIGDNQGSNFNESLAFLPLPPYDLPAVAIVSQRLSTSTSPTASSGGITHSTWSQVAKVRAADLIRAMRLDEHGMSDNAFYCSRILRPIQAAVARVEQQYYSPSFLSSTALQDRTRITSASQALRIFVAGDRSSVGKSSVCLGILGTLIASGYASPETLAYIKPATQSESTQLIQQYCEQQGIQCVAVGPLVYYRGFTRAFLAGETSSTDELLAVCGAAVDAVSHGKKVVLIDGVGFPAVGSICGTSNAAVARACGYPMVAENSDTTTDSSMTALHRSPLGVVLVGGSGVGAAVDAFNLNATYFEHQAGLPVLGGIFNKLANEGYYSLESCKSQVTTYFNSNAEQVQKGRQPFGFVPLFPRLSGKHALDHVNEYIKMFSEHVDVAKIIDAAIQVKGTGRSIPMQVVGEISFTKAAASSLQGTASSATGPPPELHRRSRHDIESLAIAAGAAPSA